MKPGRLERMVAAVREEAFDLAELVTHQGRIAVGRLGNQGVHRPQLKLADYVHPDAQPPTAVHRSHLGYPFGVLLNDGIGDCGPAMIVHGSEVFHLDAGTPVPPYADRDAEKVYIDVGKYDPTQNGPNGNPTDNGVDNADLFPYWEQHGIDCAADGSNHRAAATLFVDPTDQRLSKIAIWEFVALFRAANMPISAQGERYWRLSDPSLQGDAAPGSWGGHDYLYVSYDQHRLRNLTWGLELLVDWDWDAAYAMQGIVVVTREMLNLQGVSPAGVDWTRLNADLAKLPSVQPS